MSHTSTNQSCTTWSVHDVALAPVKSAPVPAARPDGAQVAAIFDSLDAYGQSMVWALLTCAARLQGVRG